MANWKHTLRVKEDRNAYERREIDIQELGKRFAIKLRMIAKDEEALDIACDFDVVIDVEDFDEILDRAYDWADTPLDNKWPRTRMCWIEPS